MSDRQYALCDQLTWVTWVFGEQAPFSHGDLQSIPNIIPFVAVDAGEHRLLLT